MGPYATYVAATKASCVLTRRYSSAKTSPTFSPPRRPSASTTLLDHHSRWALRSGPPSQRKLYPCYRNRLFLWRLERLTCGSIFQLEEIELERDAAIRLLRMLVARGLHPDAPMADAMIRNIALQAGLDNNEFDVARDYALQQGWLLNVAAGWSRLSPTGYAAATA